MEQAVHDKKIYFCGSIRGGREDAALYRDLISYLKKYGKVLTEHIGDEVMLGEEKFMSDADIHERDMNWLNDSDFLIAEITTPSTGVGYEVGRAVALGKPILALFRDKGEGKRPSAMISGSDKVTFHVYKELDEAKNRCDAFIRALYC